ncbi:MAG: TolC family protein [Planctomycetota bacterium]
MYSVHSHRPEFGGCGSRIQAAVFLAFFSVAFFGCESPTIDRLDLEAQRIIDAQIDRSLGVNSQSNTAVPLIKIDEKTTAEEYDPVTVNTSADALTVEPAPDVGEVAYPTILDDGNKPDTLRLDLEGIIAQAIEFSPQYRSEKEGLYLTTLSLIIERHEWGPRFFSTITGQVDGVPEAGDNDTALSLIGSLGVTQRLPYGGTISATALVDYVRFLEQAATNTLPEDSQSAALSVSLDLPLLRGAGSTANTVETRIQAERNLIYAVRGFERFRREFFVDIAAIYFDIVRRQRQLANQELQLRNFENSARLFIALAEAGREAFFRAERAEQRVLQARNALINQQEAYAATLDSLKILIGIETTRSLEIIPVEIEVPEVLLDTDSSVATALKERLDLQTDRDLVDDATRDAKIARNQLLPDLDLDADLLIPTDETRDVGGLDFEAEDGEFAVGLTLGLPLDRKIEYADYRAALVLLEREKRDFRVEQDRVALEVREAVRAIQQAEFILQLQDRAVQINERRAQQIEINQRDLGPNEVIDVQEDLLDARNDRDEAASDLKISILDYLLSTGQLRIGPDGRWLAPGRLSLPVDEESIDPVS